MSSITKSRRKWRKKNIPSRAAYGRLVRKLARVIERSPFHAMFASSYRSLLLHGSSSFVVAHHTGRAVVRSLDPTAIETRITGREASVIVDDGCV